MNKSTPLSQLPINGTNPNTFVNEQQKQMITNAQQAIQNSNLPQNTQIHQEMMNDDDATIQEVLNHINSNQQTQQTQYQQQHIPQPSMDGQSNIYQQQQQQQQIDPYVLQNMMNMNQIPPQSSHNTLIGSHSNIDMFFHIFADDIKLAILILSLFILVNFIPIGTTLGKYIAIDKIPYNDIILKGLLCAILFLFTKKMVVK